MKLSKLISLCNKAIEKYGDMTVGTYSQDYARELDEESEMHDFKLRVLRSSGDLPGESLTDEEESASKSSSARFVCFFYED